MGWAPGVFWVQILYIYNWLFIQNNVTTNFTRRPRPDCITKYLYPKWYFLNIQELTKYFQQGCSSQKFVLTHFLGRIYHFKTRFNQSIDKYCLTCSDVSDIPHGPATLKQTVILPWRQYFHHLMHLKLSTIYQQASKIRPLLMSYDVFIVNVSEKQLLQNTTISSRNCTF